MAGEHRPRSGDSHGGGHAPKGGIGLLTLGALGVVYGDIGTSPLYAVRESFGEAHDVAATEANVLGLLSLITWSLIIVITIKYLVFVLRADNDGEGGILALTSLATPKGNPTVATLGADPDRPVRHGAALRRRDHHPGDLGAVRGRGPRGGRTRHRRPGDPHRGGHPHRCLLVPEQGHRRGRASSSAR